MADLDDLLEKTSRTFALSIPLLPEPTHREVTIAYLLFRIADTFEDASHWSIAARTEALDAFVRLLRAYDAVEARSLADRWVAGGVSPHAGYAELMSETPAVLEAFLALQPPAVVAIREHVVRSAEGMAGFVRRTADDGVLSLRDLGDLRGYCYVVAGIVGEMLTELFLLGRPELSAAASYLRERASAFGEALQLVNILKDTSTDLSEGRSYLPPGVERGEVFAMARNDLNAASEYISALQAAGAARGLLSFNALPVLLAWASLEKIEREGPGAKVSRPELWEITQRMNDALDAGEPLVAVRPPIPSQT